MANKTLINFDDLEVVDLSLSDDLMKAASSAVELADNSHAPNTRRGYDRAWASFVAWCDQMSKASPLISALPATDQTLALYVGAHRDATPATMQQTLAAIRFFHLRHGLVSPFDSAPIFSVVYRGYRRSWAHHKRTPQKAATEDVLAAMIATMDASTATGIRNRAIVLLTFDGALRRSEVVALDLADLEWVAEGISIRIASSKGNTFGESHEYVPILARPGDELCPVEAVRKWIECAGRAAGPLFLQMRRAGADYCVTDERLSDKAVYRLVKKLAADAGIEGRFGAHSLRRGLITSAIQRGVSITDVQHHARHAHVNTTGIYSEASKAFAGHPNRSLLKADHEPD